MNLDTMLSYSVTTLGVLLCLFSMVFIFLGRKVAGERGTPQIVKFKDLEVQTNSVLMLFIVSVVVAALPLILLHYRPIPAMPGPSAQASPTSVSSEAESRPLYITGYVWKPDGTPLEGAQLVVTKLTKDGASQPLSEQTVDSDGSFELVQSFGHGDRIKLVTKKAGYVNQTLILGADSLNYPAVLVQQKASSHAQ